MSTMLMLDTSLIIDFLLGRPEAVQFIGAENSDFCVSAVTVAELYVGVRDGAERDVLNRFVGMMHTIEINRAIATQAGVWHRDYAKSHGTGLMDALIAACAASSGAQLATLNAEHFPMLRDVQVPYRTLSAIH